MAAQWNCMSQSEYLRSTIKKINQFKQESQWIYIRILCQLFLKKRHPVINSLAEGVVIVPDDDSLGLIVCCRNVLEFLQNDDSVDIHVDQSDIVSIKIIIFIVR